MNWRDATVHAIALTCHGLDEVVLAPDLDDGVVDELVDSHANCRRYLRTSAERLRGDGGRILLASRPRAARITRGSLSTRSVAVRRPRCTHERQSDGVGSSMSDSAEPGQGPQPADSLGADHGTHAARRDEGVSPGPGRYHVGEVGFHDYQALASASADMNTVATAEGRY